MVVELFTSQGCSSCPPADALLGKLSKRHDVLPLAFHVDYWDYIGWKDPYASKDATERQYGYGHALGLNMVYTPQMVIDGSQDVVGSDESAVLRAITASTIRKKLKLAIRAMRPAPTRWCCRRAMPARRRPASISRSSTTPIAPM